MTHPAIEAAARAIRQKCAEIDQRPTVQNADAMWFADEYAKAAIHAFLATIREPSEGMMEAWSIASPSSGTFTDETCATSDWQAMLAQLEKELKENE